LGRSCRRGDAQLDHDLPAGHPDLLDDQAQQLLTLLEGELVDAGRGEASEVAHTPTKPVVDSELAALVGQVVALVGQ